MAVKLAKVAKIGRKAVKDGKVSYTGENLMKICKS